MPLFGPRSRTILLALGLAGLFCFGLVKLFLLRFEAGDVYPPYSSLRSDPLGTQALYEGLNQMAGGTARRHFRPLDEIEFRPDRTIVLCGLPVYTQWRMRGRTWETMMTGLEQNGGRLVLAFKATSQRRDPEDETRSKDRSQDQDRRREDEAQAQDEEKSDHEEDLDERASWQGMDALGLSLERAREEDGQAAARRVSEDLPVPLPARLPWRGALFFDHLDDTWQVLYALDEQAVMVTRTWGRGTLVMVADSYFFSNEALRHDRFVDLFTWLFVPRHEVLFDESHLGLLKRGGIAALAVKYRLHGVIAVVLLVTLLLVWQQTAIFVPAPQAGQYDGEDTYLLMGRDTTQSLAHLMRQHIPPEEVLKVCYDNWVHSAAMGRVSEEKMTRVKALLTDNRKAPRAHHPVEVYRRICQLLKQGKIL